MEPDKMNNIKFQYSFSKLDINFQSKYLNFNGNIYA